MIILLAGKLNRRPRVLKVRGCHGPSQQAFCVEKKPGAYAMRIARYLVLTFKVVESICLAWVVRKSFLSVLEGVTVMLCASLRPRPQLRLGAGHLVM